MWVMGHIICIVLNITYFRVCAYSFCSWAENISSNDIVCYLNVQVKLVILLDKNRANEWRKRYYHCILLIQLSNHNYITYVLYLSGYCHSNYSVFTLHSVTGWLNMNQIWWQVLTPKPITTKSCAFESRSRRGVHYMIQFCQWVGTGRWVFSGSSGFLHQ